MTDKSLAISQEAKDAVAAAFQRMHRDVCYPHASDGEAAWAATEIIAAYLSASPSPPPSAGVDAVAVKALLNFDVREYVDEYEFRGDAGDYQPTERERVLLEDAIAGVVGSIHDAIRSALTPAPTPVEAGGEAVAFPADGELLHMERFDDRAAFWKWALGVGLPQHMEESGLGRFHADDRTEWAWQAWCAAAALAKPASEPAGVVREAEILRQAADIVERLPWHNSETIARRMRDAALSAPASSSPAEEAQS